MAKIYDVAAYILDKQGKMTTMKLQKLVYYCQAWSLVWEEKPIFNSPFEAWANGPVAPQLYHEHKGAYHISSIYRGNSSNLTDTDKNTIDAVLEFYGNKSSQWLSDLTHQEQPWISARKGYSPGERSSQVISLASMHEYYDSL
ncbi:type II toxin-antitoxin system antitoxin SocA domain-containing protein [Desulfogranum marinum]|uniref:Panacea domain-containing protein n=1 Tax=Desulfogranum marinum TaxID=453220 RepID=UPI0029C7A42F|nr:type II toxin-antitoxin system antitoxin SocA domain-containing protein [Desulfogranum marinum]